MKNNTLLWLAGIVILILSFLLAMQLNRVPVEKITTDTLTVEKWQHDTLKIDSLVPKYIKQIKTVHDTLLTRDSIPVEVEIPIQLAYFDTTVVKGQDTLQIKQTIEGYKPRLLSMQTIINRREKTTVITNTLTKSKKPVVTLSPMVGAGYGFFNKKPDIFVGVGLAFNL